MDYWMFLVLTGLCACHKVCSLFVTDINVPEIVDFRDRVTLSCSYNMSGHTLNSVKWYKDEIEFFRYSPMMHPVYMTFTIDGVEVLGDKYFCNESTCRIELGQLKKKSSGAYRCEVSGDAPHFKLATKASNMTVAALPQHDPLINGFNPTYRLDEFVVANCSSDWSSPPASLSWYINDEKAPPEILQPQQETTIYAHGFNLRLRSLEIRFYLDGHRFFNSKGNLHLKCVADINQIQSLRRELVLSASLIQNDNLNNQMLINSARTRSTSATNVISHLLAVYILTQIYWNSQLFGTR